ncbi:MAG TPA: lipid IV(A) palmitoyltransferase PagP [Burkholderiales bacterium]|nr:lipid IV(A) palmitoyltransferase PagP [Burkholderiales bacterium]
MTQFGHAQDPSFSDKVRATWDSAMAGPSELYIPTYTWHNPHDYTQGQISNFNDRPWGLGFGKGYRDQRQGWHGFYAMAFKDSHFDFEPAAGYARTWNVMSQSGGLDLGLGYTALVTLRRDMHSYLLPVPAVLPLASIGIGRVSLFGTYIPWVNNHGGVAFFFVKIRL